jgi:hypothetical protein
VYNGGVLTIYVNGSARNSGTLPNTAFGSNAFRFNIAGGGIADATGNFFNGAIDDLAVFSRALTSSEICGLYAAGVGGGPPAVDIERAGSFLLDTKPSGTPHNGQNLGASLVASDTDTLSTTRTGVVAFAAAEGDQIVVPAHADFNSPTGTITFWVRTAGTTGSGSFAAILFDRRPAAPGGPPGDVIAQTDAGGIFVQAASGAGGVNQFETTQTINDDLWHHIAYVYDQSASGSITIYIDGTEARTQANTAAWSWTATQRIEFGRSHDPFWRSFNGVMDDVRIYNTMLSATDIAAIAAGDDGSLVSASSMVLRLNFEAAVTGVTLSWPCGVLQEASALVGTGPGTQWTDVVGAAPPYSIAPQGQMKFYRVRQ